MDAGKSAHSAHRVKQLTLLSMPVKCGTVPFYPMPAETANDLLERGG